jgi:serine/threonine protein phosphatase 1
MRYAIGDIHGCYKTLVRLLDHNLQISKNDEVYFVGDYIDRGPSSRQVLDFLIERRQQGFHFYMVRGNHEEMLVDAWVQQKPDPFMLWMLNGAEETLASYGIESHYRLGEAALKELPESHIDLLRKLPYYIQLDDYLVVHAGFNFSAAQPFKDTRSMVWCRDCKNNLKKSGNRIVVAGHTPVPFYEIRKHIDRKRTGMINIDAGCVYKGYTDMGNLVALDLDSLNLHRQANIDF